MDSGKLLPGVEYALGDYRFGLSVDDSHAKYKNIVASCRNVRSGENGTKNRIVGKDSVIEGWRVEASQSMADVYASGTFTDAELPTEIRVTKAPEKTTYENGELLDFTGMVVTAFCSNGSEWGEIPLSELAFSQNVANAETTKDTGKILIRIGSLVNDLEVSFSKISHDTPLTATTEWSSGRISSNVIAPAQGEKMVALGLGTQNYDDHIWNGTSIDYTPDGQLSKYHTYVATSGAVYSGSRTTYYGANRDIATREGALIIHEQRINDFLSGNTNVAFRSKEYYEGNLGYYSSSSGYDFGLNFPLQCSNIYNHDVYDYKGLVIHYGTILLFSKVNEIEISWQTMDGRILKTYLCIFVSTDE